MTGTPANYFRKAKQAQTHGRATVHTVGDAKIPKQGSDGELDVVLPAAS